MPHLQTVTDDLSECPAGGILLPNYKLQVYAPFGLGPSQPISNTLPTI